MSSINQSIYDVLGYSIHINGNTNDPEKDKFQQFISELISHRVKDHSHEMFDLFNKTIGNFEIGVMGEKLNLRAYKPMLHNIEAIHKHYTDGLKIIVEMFKLYTKENISSNCITMERQVVVKETFIDPSIF